MIALEGPRPPNSGAQSRIAGSVRLVEDCLSLAIEELSRRRLFRGAGSRQADLSWGALHPPNLSPAVRLELHLAGSSPSWIIRYWVTGSDRSTAMHQSGALVRTRPPYGGVRWWFGCPRCGRRCGKLYLPPDRPDFACRICYRLRYVVQDCGRDRRHELRARRLVERLGGDVNDALWGGRVSWSRSPRGMRRRTFDRLYGQYVEALEACDRTLLGHLTRLNREPGGPITNEPSCTSPRQPVALDTAI